jgi:hypothetical protein
MRRSLGLGGGSPVGAALLNGGAVPVVDAHGGGVSKNRYLDLATSYASATNTASWDATDNVTKVRITFLLDDNTTSKLNGDTGGRCKLTFDATSDVVEEAWLGEAASGSLDYPAMWIGPGDVLELEFPSYLTRIGALPAALGELLVEAS